MNAKAKTKFGTGPIGFLESGYDSLNFSNLKIYKKVILGTHFALHYNISLNQHEV